MHMILGLPRGHREVYPGTETGIFNEHARTQMMRDGVGLIPDFWYGPFDDQDDGGNIEVRPGVGRELGTIIICTGWRGRMNWDVVSFLRGQDVQDMLFDLDLSWLAIGHADEVFGFSSTECSRARVSSPEVAYGLLLCALHDGDGDEAMLQCMNDCGPDGVTVVDILGNQELRSQNFASDGYAEKMHTVCETLGLQSPVSELTFNRAPADCLRRAGYLEMKDNLAEYGTAIEWKLEFFTGSIYGIYHKGPGDVNWVPDGAGHRAQDSLSASQALFILSDWWDTQLATKQGDIITFTTQPSDDMIEMPGLFYLLKELVYEGEEGEEDDVWIDLGAAYYTNDVVNCILDDTTMIVAHVWGPDSGIFDNYVQAAALRLGYTEIVFADDRWYHAGEGSFHCATNFLREIPTNVEDMWWNNLGELQ